MIFQILDNFGLPMKPRFVGMIRHASPFLLDCGHYVYATGQREYAGNRHYPWRDAADRSSGIPRLTYGIPSRQFVAVCPD